MEWSILPGLMKSRWIPDRTASGIDTAMLNPSSTEVCEISMSVELLSPATKQAVVEQFADCPHELYRLLKGEHLPSLKELIPDILELPWDRAACSCSDHACSQVSAWIQAAQQHLSMEPLLLLALLGLPREELLASVFADWADMMPSGLEHAAQENADVMEEKGKGGPSPGEWLAEAVEQGQLHEPGAALREVELKLSDPATKEPPIDDWEELLPGVPRVRQTLKEIASSASQRAAKLRRHVPKG